MFEHEKLKVHEKARRFMDMRNELLQRITRKVSAIGHLRRASESMLVNIAHAAEFKSLDNQIPYLGYANGSALECAACLDVFVAKTLMTVADVRDGKMCLREVVNMLIAMRITAANKVREERPDEYSTKHEMFFSHEKLAVYRKALGFIAWVEQICASSGLTCSADLKSKLDKASTAIVLNIAEGNGRFSGADHVTFIKTAHKAASQCASLLYPAFSGSHLHNDVRNEGRIVLQEIAGMLISLSQSASERS